MAKIKDVKIDDMEVTAIGEIPNIVTVSGDYKTEISEEVVQAVTEAIVLEAEEQEKTVEEVVSEIVEESIDETKEELVRNENLDYSGRGFKSLDDAYNFIDTERFANLGDADKIEFMNWLQK